jgi:hypothetical protein
MNAAHHHGDASPSIVGSDFIRTIGVQPSVFDKLAGESPASVMDG